jgi:uncharacterized protein with HEPN domain
MPRSNLLYLNDISEAAAHIQSYVGNLTFEGFKNDQMRVDAVVCNFEIIGEAVKNLSDELKSTVSGNRLESHSRIPGYPYPWLFRY